jgi:predicted Ser/Thr protein kinase
MSPDPPTPGEWAAVNELFHQVLDLPPLERAAFLRTACPDDVRLRSEVQSLLDAHDRAGDFIEAPAEGAARLVALALESPAEPARSDHQNVEGSPDSLIGAARGHYRIERVLGEGGMGVVYLAQDTRLGRQVALKALAPRFTGDEGRRERLRREARAAAALGHPGIAIVYALEEFGDHLYIASEYVAGRTLREELSDGPLPLTQAIDTVLDLARALSAAHERGVVHRDLKPENVMRSRSGQVKILDFGIARFADLSDGQLTEDGTLLGTPAYMAPEQIRRQRVDFRADLFAFGILAAELSTGRHPFAGGDPTSTIAKILEAEPAHLEGASISPAQAAAWPAFETIIRICLAKTPDARFQSTAQLVAALESVRGAHISGSAARAVAPPASAQPGSSAPLWWWQFHQAAATAAYVAILYPLSYVRGSDRDLVGSALFLLGIAAAAVSCTLRLHLWFTLRAYPAEWAAQRSFTSRWTRLSDSVFVAVLLAGALLLVTSHGRIAMLLVTSAVAVLLAFAVIEPATTRAAASDMS